MRYPATPTLSELGPHDSSTFLPLPSVATKFVGAVGGSVSGGGVGVGLAVGVGVGLGLWVGAGVSLGVVVGAGVGLGDEPPAPNETSTVAPVDETDTSVIETPVRGSRKVLPTPSAESQMEMVAGVESISCDWVNVP